MIESTGIAEPMPVAETFTFNVPGYEALSDIARLDTCVTVVDAANFHSYLRSTDDLKDKFGEMAQEDERTIADLLIDQVCPSFCE